MTLATLFLILIVVSIITDATGDALNDTNRKTFGHFLNGVSLLCLLAIPLFTTISTVWLVSYVFIRFAIFDGSYNLTRGLPINYIGNSSFYDKIMQKLQIDIFVRIVFLIVGISLIFKY